MTDKELKVIEDLINRGYAVCIFVPDELGEVDPERVKDAMCEAGWNCINMNS
jgi:hypothetical protein